MSLDTSLELLKCCLNKERHIVEEPIQVCECGANACKKCIQKTSEILKCLICNEEHDRNHLLNRPINKSSEFLIEIYSEKMIEQLDAKIETLKGT
jgi:hypothetical protein